MLRALPLALCLLLALLCWPKASPAQTVARLGVVVLHGKNDSPDKVIIETVRLLRNVGYFVAVPEMAWSRRRGFDVTFQQALVEIGLAVAELRAKGATQVALCGHGLGANAALAYAASRGGVFALAALAPAHDPERQREVFLADLRKAKEMLISGRGAERSLFIDLSYDKDSDLSTTAEIYLSYTDPDGAAVMPHSAAALRAPVPLLWVVGELDPLSRLGRSYVFDKVPAHPKSRYLVVPAEHKKVPVVAAPQVVEWFQGLLP